MFEFRSQTEPDPKCYVTHGTVPYWISPNEAPSAHRRPFSAIQTKSFNSAVDILLPKNHWLKIKNEFGKLIPEARWADVIMPLAAIVETEFWETFIVNGDVLMMSQGQNGTDSIYGLSNGVLRLQLSRSVYEQTGLQGNPTQFGNGKHLKNTWMVELNLRSPGMKKGKQAYDRMVWCLQNTIKEPVRWLLTDTKNPKLENIKCLDQYHPVLHPLSPMVHEIEDVHIPTLSIPTNEESEEDFSVLAEELYEHFSLISLESPRMDISDKIDTHLSRFSPLPSISGDVVKVSWTGFLSARWIQGLFVNILRLTSPHTWLWIEIHGFKNAITSWGDSEHGKIGAGENSLAILRLPWEEPPQRPSADDMEIDDKGKLNEEESKKRLHYLSWEIIDAFDAHS